MKQSEFAFSVPRGTISSNSVDKLFQKRKYIETILTEVHIS